ncbi:rab3 GTPase-activating protein catalytic subunit [Ctenocephalides felis]|uniref:rab3 GTPase-activating protein catalytic subunit n=1 Tax=Ctenocephalides felis TaxID=7515 RepID=UPI000E6E41FC|nr:rab3 GTPase-activating protein catalytic subunit [Ctenocephalides felis]
MNEEVDDNEFYHQDFTTASDWEVFIARIEEIIHEWKLPYVKQGPALLKNQLWQNNWKTSTECINFADVQFSLTRYYLKIDGADEPSDVDEDDSKSQVLIDLMSAENDFCTVDETSPIVHPLARWYGIRDFLVLSSAQNLTIDNESKIKILLSSANIAISNSHCEIPLFVKILIPSQHVYLGVSEMLGLRTNFDIIHLSKTPDRCKYFSGLLDVFKSKIASNIHEPVTFSVRHCYSLQDWTSNAWSQQPPDFDILGGEGFGLEELGSLPFGTTYDPITELLLFCSWPQLPENVAVDSETYSDFDSKQAPEWSIRVKWIDKPACLLSECISEFLQSATNSRTMKDFLGHIAMQKETANPFDKLTEPVIPPISSVLSYASKSTRSQSRKDGPIPESQLMSMLFYLFPDAQPNSSTPYNIDADIHLGQSDSTRQIKSGPVDGLVWRLSCLMAITGHWLGGSRAIAHLWYEFVEELRYRIDNNHKIPGVGGGFPDPRTCILHQQLQLLNCCVARQQERDNAASTNPENKSESPEDSDEEFYDCSDTSAGDNGTVPVALHKPEGRLSRFGSARLISTGEPIYVPITQEPAPKTEEQLEEDAEALLRLAGGGEKGAEARARLMSASLLSDMEAFKAANPGAQLEDFIKWYSPRDWIESEELDEFGCRKGELSPRMKIPGNTWLTAWQSCRPICARKQKRLFDDRKEAEKILHRLEILTLAEFVEMLLSVLMHAAADRLHVEAIGCKDELPLIATDAESVLLSVARLSREPKNVSKAEDRLKRYALICGEICELEATIARCKSLRKKFNTTENQEVNSLVGKLLEGVEVPLPGAAGGPLGEKVSRMFSDARRSEMLLENDNNESIDNIILPAPVEKQYLLRVCCPRPACSSTASPQFLRAILRNKDFRLVGAFTNDTIFTM